MKELQYPFDAAYIIKKKKTIKRQLLADGSSRIKKNIAVLGGSTTDDIVKVMELFLLDNGIEPVFYESEYAAYEQEANFPSEEFLNFNPDIIYVHTSNRNIRLWPEISDSEDMVDEKLKSEIERFENIRKNLEEKFQCPVIQNNFEPPFFRLLGNRDCYDFRGRSNFLQRMNESLYEYAKTHDNFHINDLAYLEADYGIKEWANPLYWNMYKYCLCPDAIPYLSFSVANIIKSIFGKNKKAMALDLDNTLWGGVVGDDGVEGIEIGQETGAAQSYFEFQDYIKQFKDMGILLNVCSKNDEENALEGLKHPDGALSPDDFVIIKANWENKDLNIANIAAELNILPESIVFIDDNPAEREIVEAQLKGVQAPVIGNVEDYIITIDRSGFFEVTSFNEDDLKRNEMYKENAMRQSAQATFADYGEYLKSLEMNAVIEDFIPVYISRITQLTNKSNQFNLTTKRYTPAEMEATWKDSSYIRLYGKLTDKFGDNGVVSVVIGKKENDELHVELWLMSCRVLKRDMEQAMLDVLVKKCQDAGIKKIIGYYYPTKKNSMVKELYGDFGFDKVSEDDDGNTVWKLSVEDYRNQNRYIKIDGTDAD